MRLSRPMRSKARMVAAATGLAALADDTGLEVAALGVCWGCKRLDTRGPGVQDMGRQRRQAAG